jgi:hypothetical protein
MPGAFFALWSIPLIVLDESLGRVAGSVQNAS